MDLNKLEELARAATPGEWVTDEPWVVCSKGVAGNECIYLASVANLDAANGQDERDAAHIAAANPSAILDLIALVSKQEGELSAAREANDIMLEQSNAQIGEIERLEAAGKESLHVGELPALPDPSPTHYKERGLKLERMEMYTAEQMRSYGRACIAAARPAIWHEGCDTALAHGAKAAEWPEAERISNLPAVHEAIQGFADDLTGDNAVLIVREVMRELAKIGGVK